MIPTIHTKQLIALTLCVCSAGCKSRPVFPIFPVFGERIVNCPDCKVESSSGSSTTQLAIDDSDANNGAKPTGILVSVKSALNKNKPLSTEKIENAKAIAAATDLAKHNVQSNDSAAESVAGEKAKSAKKHSILTGPSDQKSSQESELKKSSRRINQEEKEKEKEVSGELSSKKLTSIEKFDLGMNAVNLKSQEEKSGQAEIAVDEMPTSASPELKEGEAKPIQPTRSSESDSLSKVHPNFSANVSGSISETPATLENSSNRTEEKTSRLYGSSVNAFVRKDLTPVSTVQQETAENSPTNLPHGFRIVNTPIDTPIDTTFDPKKTSTPEFDAYYNSQASANPDQPLELEMRIKDWPTEPKPEPRAFQIQQELKMHRQLTGNVAPGIDDQQMAASRLASDSAKSPNPMRNASHRKMFSDQFGSRKIIEEERGNWAGANDQEPPLSLNAIPKSQSVSLAPVVEVTSSRQSVQSHPPIPSNPWNHNFDNNDSQPDLPGRSLVPLNENDPIRDLPPISPENRYTNRPEQGESSEIDR